MENKYKKVSFIILFFVCIVFSIHAQSEKKQIYKAFLSGDMRSWKTIMDNFAAKGSLTNAQKIELINFYYGYIGYQIEIGNKELATKYVNRGEALINELLKTDVNNADLYAYKSAFIGFKIGISPLKAPFIGKSSIQNVNKAISLAPDNIQANIEQANILYYSPSTFGGNKTEAKKYYAKAIELYENNSQNSKEDWLYLSLLTSVGKIYTEDKNYEAAKRLYEKILIIEPSFNYVKDNLYPAILKKNR